MRDKRGTESGQEQCVAPRRAAPAEPHKRQAVGAATVAAGDHVGTVIDISGPEEAAPVAAPTSGWKMVVRGRARAAQRQAAAVAAGGRKSRAAKPAAGMPPGMSGPMAFIMDAIRCGRAFDCTQCGELGLWQGPRCESCFILDAIRCGRAFDCAQCGELGVWQSPRCGGCEGTVEG